MARVVASNGGCVVNVAAPLFYGVCRFDAIVSEFGLNAGSKKAIRFNNWFVIAAIVRVLSDVLSPIGSTTLRQH